jgi:hypothetical protein
LVSLYPRAFFGGLQACLRWIRLPITEIKAHANNGFRCLTRPKHCAINKVRQAICPHAATSGQAKAKEHSVKNVALTRPIGACNYRKTLFEGDGHRPPKGFELLKPNLIDMNQQVARDISDLILANFS